MRRTFKVIKIINEYNIVINAGSEQGLSRHDQLEIFVPGEEVLDPDTNESLGTLDFIKAYISVKDLFPKMAICENSETRSNNLLSFMDNFTVEETDRLNVETTEISGGLSGSRKIQIGDLVRKSK